MLGIIASDRTEGQREWRGIHSGRAGGQARNWATIREHPLITSANFSDFLTPSPLSAFGEDLCYTIHATSPSSSAFP